MKTLRTFWQAAERLATAGVMLEWHREVRDQEVMAAAKHILVPMSEPAHDYPCTNSPRCPCAHAVITHKDGVIVAVCTCDDEDYLGCEPIPVTEVDLIRYQVDFPKVFRGMCKVAGMELEPTPDMDFREPIRFGTLNAAGFSVPAYFILGNSGGLSIKSLITLIAGSADPLIIFSISPMHLHINSPNPWLDESRLLIALSELFSGDDGGRIRICKDLREIVEAFGRRVAAHVKGQQTRDALLETAFRQTNAYHTIAIGGREFPDLTDLQADVVRILHGATMDGISELSYAAIACQLAELHADDVGFEPPEKMSKIFRANDGRGKVVDSPRRGYYRLNV